MNIRFSVLIALVILGIAIVGCQSDSKIDTDTSKLSTEAAKVTETVSDQAAKLRATYVEKVETKLADVTSQVSKWKDKLGDLPPTTKPLAEKSFTALESAQDKAISTLDELKDADISEWKDHIPKVDEAFVGVSNAMKKIKSFF